MHVVVGRSQVRGFIIRLWVVAVLLSTVCMAHALLTGIAVPYPDPTVEQQVYTNQHLGINRTLFALAAGVWLTFGIGSVAFVARGVFALTVDRGLWRLRRRAGNALPEQAKTRSPK